MEMTDILKTAVQRGASDVHIVIGNHPMIRVRGGIAPMDEFPKLTAEESKRLIYSILFDAHKAKFERNDGARLFLLPSRSFALSRQCSPSEKTASKRSCG